MTHLTFCSVFKDKTSAVRIQKDLVFFSLIMNIAVDFSGSPVVVFLTTSNTIKAWPSMNFPHEILGFPQ